MRVAKNKEPTSVPYFFQLYLNQMNFFVLYILINEKNNINFIDFIKGGIIMSVSYEFFKEEEYHGNFEDNLHFMLSYYHTAIEMYRVMKMQTEINEKQKADAHEALGELRKREKKIRTDKIHLSEKDKLEMAEKKEFLTKQREKDVSMYYKGKKIEYDQLVHLLFKYQSALEYVENADKWGRGIVGKGAKVGGSVVLWPLKKMCNIVSNVTESVGAQAFLMRAEYHLERLPCRAAKHITREINLDDHLSKMKENKQKDGEFEFSISL